MKNIINELKQVFEFEGEVTQENIIIESKKLTIENVEILEFNSNDIKFTFNEIVFKNSHINITLDKLLNNFGKKDENGNLIITAKIVFDDCLFDTLMQTDIESQIYKNCIIFENSISFKRINLYQQRFLLERMVFKNKAEFDFKTKSIEQISFLATSFQEFPKINFSKTDETFISFIDAELLVDLNITEEKIFLEENNIIDFTGVKFNKNIIFGSQKSKSTNRISFPRIEKINIKSKLYFEQVQFLGHVKLNNAYFSNSIHFEGCFFYKQINFYSINFEQSDDYSFQGSEFYKLVNFNKINFLHYVDFSKCRFKENVSFEEATFKSLANFEECTFEKDANFKKANFKSLAIDCEGVVNQTRFTNTIFMGIANFTDATFGTKPSFSKAKFIKDAIFNNIQPSHHIYFKDSEFFENANFKNIEKLNHSYFDRVIFHKNVDFTNTNFIDYVSFTQANFKGAAYFNNAIFKNFINMSNCTIDDVISFYDAKLYYTPYLSGANVDKNARFNLMHIKQNHKIDIEQAVDEYMKNLKEDKEHIRKNKEYGKIEIAQGFRESFRILKSYLITNHNLLEASFYRVNELKAKELEMDLTKDKLSLSEKLEKILFQLYKITSNHHSDLLLILFTILSVIGGYYLFNLVIEFCYFKFNYWDLFKYCFYGLMAYMIYCLVLAFIECILNKDFKKYKFIYFISYALLIFSVLGIWNEPRVVTPFIGVFSDNAKNHFLNKAIINLEDYQAISIANRLNPTAIYLNESQAKKDLLANKDIIKEDELILNAYNEALLKGKNADEFMARINIIYYILMILCLFSLQKTARKNSIIPN